MINKATRPLGSQTSGKKLFVTIQHLNMWGIQEGRKASESAFLTWLGGRIPETASCSLVRALSMPLNDGEGTGERASHVDSCLSSVSLITPTIFSSIASQCRL